MKFNMKHYFDFPVEKVVELLKNGEDLCPMDKLPNVNDRKIIEQKRDGKKMYSTVEWCVHGQIPPVAQKLVNPDMLTFTEKTVWDDDQQSFTTKIIPHVLKNQLDCNTVSMWERDKNGKTVRTFRGDLTIKIPIIGPLLEKTVVDLLKKNNDKNAELVKEYLSEKFATA